MVALVSEPPEMETIVAASVTVLDVYPWPEPFTHPDALTLLTELVAAVAATEAPDGEILISTHPPRRQTARGAAITLLSGDDIKYLDTFMWFFSLWDRSTEATCIRW
jgi:hypothetical protein